MATETGESATETGDGAVDDSVTEADESGYSDYIRSVIVTTVATLFGMLAGIASTLLANSPGDRIGLLALVGAIIVQFPFYYLLGMDVDDFGTKGKLYIGFMTFVLWFISWGLLLTTGALQ